MCPTPQSTWYLNNGAEALASYTLDLVRVRVRVRVRTIFLGLGLGLGLGCIVYAGPAEPLSGPFPFAFVAHIRT